MHDSFVATGPDGRQYPTWHPPSVGDCHFGHEHGSNPNRFPFATSPVVFGYTGLQAGDAEPHVGFKVYVVDDRARNLWWRLTFHQGSGSPNRAFVQHHSIDVLVHHTDGRKLTDVHLMADTGGSRPKCGPAVQISGTAGESSKLVPTDACLTDFYESWPASARIGGLFDLAANFDIDNAVTAVHRNGDGSWSNSQVVYVASLMSPACPPADPNSDCNRMGDKRQILAPRLTLGNSGAGDVIRTDPFGAVVSSGGIPQFVLRGFNLVLPATTNFINGVDGGDIQIYRPLTSCNSNDCNPRNFTDGTVIPPN